MARGDFKPSQAAELLKGQSFENSERQKGSKAPDIEASAAILPGRDAEVERLST